MEFDKHETDEIVTDAMLALCAYAKLGREGDRAAIRAILTSVAERREPTLSDDMELTVKPLKVVTPDAEANR